MKKRKVNIDAHGYRANVAIAICNDYDKLFWGKRVGMEAWQFPQGGIRPNESSESAMFRELHEETGLLAHHVEIIGSTQDWLRYRLPNRFIRRNSTPVCIGQKQIWYLLRLTGTENDFNLSSSNRPEFDNWRWIDFWKPVEEVVSFKKEVYKKALTELSVLLDSRIASDS